VRRLGRDGFGRGSGRPADHDFVFRKWERDRGRFDVLGRLRGYIVVERHRELVVEWLGAFVVVRRFVVRKLRRCELVGE
jgi:hypothetical protein